MTARHAVAHARKMTKRTTASQPLDTIAVPRNQRGEVPTKTPRETLTRLREKSAHNHGGANRQRIRVRIAARVKDAVTRPLVIPISAVARARRPRLAAPRRRQAILWVVPLTAALLGPVIWKIVSKASVSRAAR